MILLICIFAVNCENIVNMVISSDYKFREIAGEIIAVKQGTQDVDMTRVISLNSSAYALYKEFAGKDFTTEDVEEALIRIYGISIEEAKIGAKTWIDSMVECCIIEK